MKLSNFEVLSDTSLRIGNRAVNLHSDYEFLGFEFCNRSRSLELRWSKFNESWVSKDAISKLSLRFSNVSVLSMRSRDPDRPFWEDQSLEFMGFLHPEDLETMDGFLPPSCALDGYHLIFAFHGAFSIKVYSETAEAIIAN